MRELKQSSTANVMLFMADSTDHITGKTGLTLAVTLSKDGAAFASITPVVIERTSGWYNVALTATDTGTVGDLILRATSTGADASERALNVVANVESDTYARVGAPAGASIAADLVAIDNFVDDLETRLTAARAGYLDNLDAAVSSRLASAGYTAPDNAGITAIKAKTDNLPSGVKKNAALNNFEFLLVDSTDNKTGKTGLSVTATRSIDGAAFSACANSALEVGSGVYKINIAASDLNGDVITLKFSATGANDRLVTIKTSA